MDRSSYLVGTFSVVVVLLLAFLAGAMAGAQEVPGQPPSPDGAEMSTLNITGRVPLPGMPLGNQIIVFFDAPIVRPNDAEGSPIAPFSVSPELPGKYMVRDNYAALLLKDGVVPEPVVYDVRIHPELLSEDGRAVAEATRSFVVPAQTPGLHGLGIAGVTDEYIVVRVNLGLRMNEDSVRAHIGVRDANGQALEDWAFSGISQPGGYALAFPRAAAMPVRVTVRAGAQSEKGKVKLPADVAFQFPAEGGPLTVKGAEWRKFSRSMDGVAIQFSHPVSHKVLKKDVTLFQGTDGPKINFDVATPGTHKEHGLRPRGNVRDVDTLTLKFARLMPAESLHALAEPVEMTVTNPDAGLHVRRHQWNRPQGSESPELRIWFDSLVAPEALKAHCTVEPAVDGLSMHASGYRGLALRGDWKAGTEYRITLDAGLENAGGGKKLGKKKVLAAGEPPKVSGVSFDHEGKYYFPRKAANALAIRARNKESVTVRVHRLFPSNTAAAVDAIHRGYANWQFNREFAEDLGSKEITLPPAEDETITVPLKLDELLPDGGRGVYTVQLGDSYRHQNTKVILWTDIGVLAHWQEDEVAVFAHDLFSLAPLHRAKVSVYSSKQQFMGTANTDREGVAHLKALDTSLGAPKVVVVETEHDYTFLDLEERDAGIDAGKGMAPYAEEGYDAFLYADRNLYRPGATVHARWIVRTADGAALQQVPLQVRLLNPRKVALLEEPATLSEFGTGGMDFHTETAYLTGEYHLELKVPGADRAIGAYTFHLEEFVPNRIETKVQVEEEYWLPGQAYGIEVAAEHMFGASAADRACKTEVILRKGDFTPEGWEEFRFTNDAGHTPGMQSLGEKKTDDQGRAAFEFTYQADKKISCPLAATVRASVAELGGRAAVGTADTTILPARTLLGVNASAEGDPGVLSVAVAAVQPGGAPAEAESVQVTLEKQEWHYHVRRYGSRNEPGWSRSYVPLKTEEAALKDGRGRVQFDLPDWGYLRVRVHSGATPHYSSVTVYRDWRGDVRMAEGVRPSLIQLTLNQEEYRIGDEVRVRIESPFDGKGLVVVQGAAIQRVMPVEVRGGMAELRFLATEEQVPNVWVEATVVHRAATLEPEAYPYSSFAMANVQVEAPAHKLQVELPGLPESTEPEQELVVAVETRDHTGAPISAEVTLAAVDEGIHALLDYKNPDPYAWFQRSRQADQRRAHYYDKVAYDFEAPPIGGGLLAKRLGQAGADVTENWIKPVALWSGVVMTDENGAAAIPLQLPEFSGKLRWVAVAASADATGACADTMRVRRPHMLRTSMPRFAHPNDQFQCRATIFNTTDEPCTADVRWSARDALESSAGSATLEIGAGSEASAVAEFAAGAEAGQGAIRWQVNIRNTDGEVVGRLEEDAALPVLTPAAYRTESKLAVVAPGEVRTFANTTFVEDARLETEISVSSSPFQRLLGALDYLVRYPYGCVEQVTSRCLPMYLLRKHEYLMGEVLDGETTLERHVKSGIDRLFSMQLPNGGFGSWPGSMWTYDYGSVYAAHFLTLVHRDHAFDLPEIRYESLLKFVKNVARQPMPANPGDRYLVAYALYVLALNGDIEAVEQLGRFEDTPLPAAGRSLLAAAVAMHSQQPAQAQAILDGPTEEPDRRLPGGTLNNELRDMAVRTLALLQLDPVPDEVHQNAQILMRRLEEGQRRTTQDMALVCTALAAYLDFAGVNNGNAAATISGAGKEAQIAGDEYFSHAATGSGVSYEVANTGDAPIFVHLVTAGIPEEPRTEPVSKGIKIARTYLGDGGQVQQGATFAHGASYLVKLELECFVDVENVLIADLLPAGFEVVNPRLDADALAGRKLPAAAAPEHLEVRDEKVIVVFKRLSSGNHAFYYLVRAVTPGEFQQPAVEAECMYDPDIRAATVHRHVRIQ